MAHHIAWEGKRDRLYITFMHNTANDVQIARMYTYSVEKFRYIHEESTYLNAYKEEEHEVVMHSQK